MKLPSLLLLLASLPVGAQPSTTEWQDILLNQPPTTWSTHIRHTPGCNGLRANLRSILPLFKDSNVVIVHRAVAFVEFLGRTLSFDPSCWLEYEDAILEPLDHCDVNGVPRAMKPLLRTILQENSSLLTQRRVSRVCLRNVHLPDQLEWWAMITRASWGRKWLASEAMKAKKGELIASLLSGHPRAEKNHIYRFLLLVDPAEADAMVRRIRNEVQQRPLRYELIYLAEGTQPGVDAVAHRRVLTGLRDGLDQLPRGWLGVSLATATPPSDQPIPVSPETLVYVDLVNTTSEMIVFWSNSIENNWNVLVHDFTGKLVVEHKDLPEVFSNVQARLLPGDKMRLPIPLTHLLRGQARGVYRVSLGTPRTHIAHTGIRPLEIRRDPRTLTMEVLATE